MVKCLFYSRISVDKVDIQYMNKEKTNKVVIFRIQPSLLKKLQVKSEQEYKTVSQTIRELIINYIKNA